MPAGTPLVTILAEAADAVDVEDKRNGVVVTAARVSAEKPPRRLKSLESPFRPISVSPSQRDRACARGYGVLTPPIRQPGWLSEPRGFASPPRGGFAFSCCLLALSLGTLALMDIGTLGGALEALGHIE